MHIAFVSLGAFGHINPTLALVTELVKKGVRVTYFTTEAFRTIIEPTGAKFVAVPSWMAENDKHNEDGEKKEDDGGEAAAVPFLFLNEAGAYIDTVLDTLKTTNPTLSSTTLRALPAQSRRTTSRLPTSCSTPATPPTTATR